MKRTWSLILTLSACQMAPVTPPPIKTQLQSTTIATASSASSVASVKPVALTSSRSASNPIPTQAANQPVVQPIAQAAVQPTLKPTPAAPVKSSATGLLSIPIASLNIPRGFDYATTQDVQVDIQVKSPNGAAYQQVMVAIYATDHEGFNPLIRGVTDASGRYQDLMRIPGYHSSLQVQVSALGIENHRQVPILNKQITARFGS
ncbi:MAG: hypothetical protein AB7I41_10655 [Candidatus Sericytochromatia bacterium]